jgi:hypothetical protein
MSQSELMASIAEVRAKQDQIIDGIREIRVALVLQKLNQTTPRDVRKGKQIKHLNALHAALGLKSTWFRAGQIALILKGQKEAPVGLEYAVRELRALGCTCSKSRIHQHLTRNE